jgi:uncharacterized GH25 family protein
MMRKLILIFFLIIVSYLTAHEFWLEPQKFILKKGEVLKLNFRVGEHFHGENWNGNRSSVNSLELFYNGVTDELTSLIPDSLSGDSLTLQFFDEGTAMIAYHSTNKFIELPPEKFLEYLKEDGIHNAVEYRSTHNETDSAGKEFYQRCSKTVVRIGALHDATYMINCGLPLELIPQQDPYGLKKGQALKVRLLYQNEPVTGALIKLWHRVNGKTEERDLTTDKNGDVHFSPSLLGTYMVSSVKMTRIDSPSKANWQSYWASLTWGY